MVGGLALRRGSIEKLGGLGPLLGRGSPECWSVLLPVMSIRTSSVSDQVGRGAMIDVIVIS
jgi:hypothetical protein